MKTGQFQMILFFAALFLCPVFASAEDSDPNVIRFVVYVLDVDDIDGAEQNFAANVFVRLRWKDPRLADETNSKPHFVERGYMASPVHNCQPIRYCTAVPR